MNAVQYVMLANGIVWLAMGLYLTFLGRSTAELNRRLVQLELLRSSEAGDEL